MVLATMTCYFKRLIELTTKDLDLLHASGNEAQLAQVSEIEGICTKQWSIHQAEDLNKKDSTKI